MYKRVVLSENLNVFAMSDIKTFCRLTDTTEDGLLRQMVEASIKEVEAHTNNYITQKIVKITTTGSMVELVGEVDEIESVRVDGVEVPEGGYSLTGCLLTVECDDDSVLTITYSTKRVDNAAVDMLIYQLVANKFGRNSGNDVQPDWSLANEITRIPVL